MFAVTSNTFTISSLHPCRNCVSFKLGGEAEFGHRRDGKWKEDDNWQLLNGLLKSARWWARDVKMKCNKFWCRRGFQSVSWLAAAFFVTSRDRLRAAFRPSPSFINIQLKLHRAHLTQLKLHTSRDRSRILVRTANFKRPKVHPASRVPSQLCWVQWGAINHHKPIVILKLSAETSTQSPSTNSIDLCDVKALDNTNRMTLGRAGKMATRLCPSKRVNCRLCC